MMAGTAMVLLMLLGGCAQISGLDEHASSYVGRNVDLVRAQVAAPQSHGSRAGWQEATYRLGNGHWVYVAPDRRHCEIHYEVNGDNIVVGYTPVGPGCRYQ